MQDYTTHQLFMRPHTEAWPCLLDTYLEHADKHEKPLNQSRVQLVKSHMQCGVLSQRIILIISSLVHFEVSAFRVNNMLCSASSL